MALDIRYSAISHFNRGVLVVAVKRRRQPCVLDL